jgi:metal-sulfur cluster biosynthetic enzyme
MPSLFQRFKSLWTKEQPPAPVPPPEVTPVAPSSSPQGLEQSRSDISLDQEYVYDALRKCYDPEIPVNIVDLGLVYDVQITGGQVEVKMSLTTQGCGMGGYIANEAAERIRDLPGVQGVNVEIVWDPPWDPSMISPAGRRTLGLPEG